MKAIRITYMTVLIIAFAVISTTWAIAQEEERTEGWFYADEHPEIVEALGDHEYAQGVLDALADAGTNWTELWEAIDRTEGIVWSHTCWLVINMPHLDRLEMTKDTLQEHARFAYATRTQLPYTAPQELFREYILTYRIGDEPVRPWRSEIWWEYADLVGESIEETARAINQWVYENLEVRERGFFGPRPDPMSVIRAGTGTESDIAAVAIAMCKTFGVPARSARVSVLGEEEGGRTWLEVYTDDGWVPMYPDNPDAFGDTGLIERDHPHNVTVVSVSAAFTNQQVTSRYSDTGTVVLRFTRNGEPVEDFEHFSVSAWNDGAWLPLDDLGFDLEEERMTAEEGGFPAVLGDGVYVVQAGVRNARGDAYVQTVPVTVEPGDEIELTIALDVPLSETELVDLVQRRIDPLPQVDFSYASDTTAVPAFPSDLAPGEFACIVIFDAGGEPSIRMVPLVADWARESETVLIGVGIGERDTAEAFWIDTIGESTISRFYADPEGLIAGAFGHRANEEGEYTGLPLVMLLSPNTEIVFLKEGYDLSVGEGLARAMELVGM